MKCPNCGVEINADFKELAIGSDPEGAWSVFRMNCPNHECRKMIIDLAIGPHFQMTPGGNKLSSIASKHTVKPLTSSRTVPKEVEKIYANDFSEAALVLPLSPKASAALSRRCLQNILREKAGVKKSDLSKEIDEVLASGKLPSHLTESIDAVRHIGNFAAHPVKSLNTGEIVEVEAGEAEWLLDVLEGLFDFYFVQPEILKRKRNELNEKLKAAGKPLLK